jgi:uncharacterized membrane protein (GlpM family)
MLPATVVSAMVVLIAYLLHLVAVYFGIPLNDGVLTAAAIAIVSWILGQPAGTRVHNALFARGQSA